MISSLFSRSCFLGLLLSVFLANATQAQNHHLATFNIRYANPGDSGNLWEDRLPKVVSLIQFHQLEIIGIQEGLHHQVQQLEKTLGFPYVGVGRDDGAKAGEFSAIFYDPAKYQLEEGGTFWLSPTPDQPSKGWDAALNRICSWGKFVDQKGTRFFVFNIHYDHIGQQAREESSKLLIQKIQQLNPDALPAILMGDFNVTPENPAYTTIVQAPGWEDARLLSKIPTYGPAGTFTGFNWEMEPDRIIDHIFVQGPMQVIRHGILSDNYGKKYPSDHFPVMVELIF